MGFIDYVAEYFRGPAGETGPQGEPGAPGEPGAGVGPDVYPDYFEAHADYDDSSTPDAGTITLLVPSTHFFSSAGWSVDVQPIPDLQITALYPSNSSDQTLWTLRYKGLTSGLEGNSRLTLHVTAYPRPA